MIHINKMYREILKVKRKKRESLTLIYFNPFNYLTEALPPKLEQKNLNSDQTRKKRNPKVTRDPKLLTKLIQPRKQQIDPNLKLINQISYPTFKISR